MNRTAIVIGSGFAGMSAATFMAKAGWSVTVIERHSSPGGRARQLEGNGFTFDMGPSWYWMPDVFERYFSSFGKKVEDYYSLKRLDPSYRVFWSNGYTDIPADKQKLSQLFESWEPGAAGQLDRFLNEAAHKYKVGMQKLVYKPGLSFLEFADASLMKDMFRLDVFTSIRKHISKYFRDVRIKQLLEFPVLFLGALPQDTPALYSLMNYADIEGGTWYPKGGIYSVVDAIHRLAEEKGVQFRLGEEVTGFTFSNKKVSSVVTTQRSYDCDVVIAGADYNYVEQQLLPLEHRTYSPEYWNNRQLSPSCLLYYVGINRRLQNVCHHNLFFDVPFSQHADEIYKSGTWPVEPLFYLSVSSKTDPMVAPDGSENLFFLIPVAAGLQGDTEAVRENYFDMLIARVEKHTGVNIANHIVYKKTFGYSDFVSEYHSFRGNAYGLANTLRQTALFKPSCRSSKLSNLFYTGQLTVPGPGVPPSLISGEVVAGVANANVKQRS